MIGEWIRFGLCAFCVLGGLFAVFTAILGLFRFDFGHRRRLERRVLEARARGRAAVVHLPALGAHAGPARIPDGRGSARAS